MKPIGVLFTIVIAVLFLKSPAQAQNIPQNIDISKALSSMPISFIPNLGQWDDQVLFRAEANGATFFYGKGKIAYLFIRNTEHIIETPPGNLPNLGDRLYYKKEAFLLRANLIGSNYEAPLIGEGIQSQYCNYFLGNDNSRWQTHVPNYSAIIYENIYRDIDLKFYGDSQFVKYDFIVGPGADLSQIRIQYSNIENLTVDETGNLMASTRLGSFNEQKPYSFQVIDGIKHEVSVAYQLKSDSEFGFVALEDYDRSCQLIIDPTITYGTYFGGGQYDEPYGIDSRGNYDVYITGYTGSTDFPAFNGYDDSLADYVDVFVAKFNTISNWLTFSTFIGGNGYDRGRSIVVDNSGNAFITGLTTSSDFPTYRAFDDDFNTAEDAFVLGLSSDGDSLIMSTYLGGVGDDMGFGIANDDAGNCYVTGYSGSTDFPTYNAFDNSNNGGYDVFAAKINIDNLIYSTFIGGNHQDYGFGIDIDNEGSAYIVGHTMSSNFPTFNAYDAGPNGSSDAFVTKLSPEGDSLVYSTYIGASDNDIAVGIAVDESGEAFVSGGTSSNNFPTVNAYDDSHNGVRDAFVLCLSPAGNSLNFSTFLGGSDDDYSFDIALSPAGNPVITGTTSSTDFPTVNPFDAVFESYTDAFVAKFQANGSTLIYSSYLGGLGYDYGNAVVVSSPGAVCISGTTASEFFPTQNPYDNTYNGGYDVFLAKLSRDCEYVAGDANSNNVFNGLDVSYSVNYLKGLGPEPPDFCNCPPNGNLRVAADANGNCAFNGLDVTYSVNYLKGLGPAPQGCEDCLPGR